MVAKMARNAASTSTHVVWQPDREPGHIRQPARVSDKQRIGPAPRSTDDQSLDSSRLNTSPTTTNGASITDNISEFVAVLDRELDTIEVYLAGALEEILGRPHDQ